MTLAFNFPPPQTSALRHGEIAVDLFAGGGGASNAIAACALIFGTSAINRSSVSTMNCQGWALQALGAAIAASDLARHRTHTPRSPHSSA